MTTSPIPETAQQPRDLDRDRARSEDDHARGAEASGRRSHGVPFAAPRGERVHGRPHRGGDVAGQGRSLGQQAVAGEQLERLIDRRSDRLADVRDDLVDRARPVEQRDEDGQQLRRGRALEGDDVVAVLEEQPLAAPHDPVPGRDQGPFRDLRRRAQHGAHTQQQLHELEQQSHSIAKNARR